MNSSQNGALSVEKINADEKSAIAAINSAKNVEELKQVKIEYIGDKSPLAKANQALGSLDPQQRAEFGKIIGAAKNQVNQVFAQKSQALESEKDAQVLLTERVDVTLPNRQPLPGGLHPLTLLTNEISDLFLGLGYEVKEGPELESEWLNLMH
jgi:phenylalanyl-tRNA synthetase alpha chain